MTCIKKKKKPPISSTYIFKANNSLDNSVINYLKTYTDISFLKNSEPQNESRKDRNNSLVQLFIR